MNGRKLYVRPATTATFVASSRPSVKVSRPSVSKNPATGPVSDRIVFHAIVRTRKLVKNGAITRTSMMLRQRPDLNAIV
jgi:hypothetical protein